MSYRWIVQGRSFNAKNPSLTGEERDTIMDKRVALVYYVLQGRSYARSTAKGVSLVLERKGIPEIDGGDEVMGNLSDALYALTIDNFLDIYDGVDLLNEQSLVGVIGRNKPLLKESFARAKKTILASLPSVDLGVLGASSSRGAIIDVNSLRTRIQAGLERELEDLMSRPRLRVATGNLDSGVRITNVSVKFGRGKDPRPSLFFNYTVRPRPIKEGKTFDYTKFDTNRQFDVRSLIATAIANLAKNNLQAGTKAKILATRVGSSGGGTNTRTRSI